MSELTLDDDERHALSGRLNGVGVTQLVWANLVAFERWRTVKQTGAKLTVAIELKAARSIGVAEVEIRGFADVGRIPFPKPSVTADGAHESIDQLGPGLAVMSHRVVHDRSHAHCLPALTAWIGDDRLGRAVAVTPDGDGVGVDTGSGLDEGDRVAVAPGLGPTG